MSPPSRRTLVLLTVAALVPLLMPADLSMVARLTTAVFLVTLVASGFTKISEVTLTTVTLVSLVLIGASSVGDVARELTGGTLWLLMGAFVVAAAAKRSGLAERAAVKVAGPATSVGALFTRITLMLVGTSFLVPSTAGRAALMVPVFQAIAAQIPERSVRRGVALLFPVGILLSAVASLLGAGAHIVTAELVAGLGGQNLDIVRWTLYGLPFALGSCAVAAVVIVAMFIPAEDRRARLDLSGMASRGSWSRAEFTVGVTMTSMIVLWLTEGVHGVPMWMTALAGAALLLVLRVTTLSAARSAVPFDLLFLMVATVEVGKALARTGAADWIATSLLGPVVSVTGSTFVVVAAVAIVSLLAHLVVTSRTARASVLVPVVMLLGGAAGIDLTAIAFLSSTAAGYCLSSTSSAKPMAVFARVGDDAYSIPDLKRLSLVLLPLHFCLLIMFAFVVWPLLGMSLNSGTSTPDGGSTPSGRGDGSVAVGGDRAVAGASIYPWSPLVVPDLGVGPRWAPSPANAGGEPAAGLPAGGVDGQPDTPGLGPIAPALPVATTVPGTAAPTAVPTLAPAVPAPTVPPTSPLLSVVPTVALPPSIVPEAPPIALPADDENDSSAGGDGGDDDESDGSASRPVRSPLPVTVPPRPAPTPPTTQVRPVVTSPPATTPRPPTTPPVVTAAPAPPAPVATQPPPTSARPIVTNPPPPAVTNPPPVVTNPPPAVTSPPPVATNPPPPVATNPPPVVTNPWPVVTEPPDDDDGGGDDDD